MPSKRPPSICECFVIVTGLKRKTEKKIKNWSRKSTREKEYDGGHCRAGGHTWRSDLKLCVLHCRCTSWPCKEWMDSINNVHRLDKMITPPVFIWLALVMAMMTENLRTWPVEEWEVMQAEVESQLGWKWWNFLMMWLLPNSFCIYHGCSSMWNEVTLEWPRSKTAHKGTCRAIEIWSSKNAGLKRHANGGDSELRTIASACRNIISSSPVLLLLPLFTPQLCLGRERRREKREGDLGLKLEWYTCTLYESIGLQL